MTDDGMDMTVPDFVHDVARTLATVSGWGDGVPMLALPPREPGAGVGARREQVRAAVEAAVRELDRALSKKRLPPAGTPAATLGRRLVSRGEHVDVAAGTYTPGPGFAALLTALVDDAREK